MNQQWSCLWPNDTFCSSYMTTASTIHPHTHNPTDTITLDETARHRRRVRMVSDGGIEFLLDLPQARLLRNGEGIELSDGRIIEVIAEPEPLFEVRAKDPHQLLKLSWQLGNRHLPTQILGDHLRIRQDHVIKEMLEGLGAVVTEIVDAFDPEGGAYNNMQRHGHKHADD